MTKRKYLETNMILDTPAQQKWVFPVSSHVHNASCGKRKKSVTLSNPWSKEDFSFQGKLGKGRFGKVYKAVYRRKQDSDNESRSTTSFLGPCTNAALKQFSKGEIQKAQSQGDCCFALLRNEINMHSHLQHRNIIPMIGYFTTCRSIYMVLEYAPKGRIDVEAMKRLPPSKRLSKAKSILSQVCRAIDYLHNLQIAHRDVKPENILCFHNNTFKLCDFGWATWWKPGRYHNTLCGTPEFVPPELLRNDGYSPEHVDPWAMGVLSVELVDSKTPFITDVDKANTGFDKNKTFDCIRKFKGDPVQDPKADPTYRDFVNRLMQVEPTCRMTAGEALQHRFLASRRSPLRTIQAPTVAQRCALFEQTAS